MVPIPNRDDEPPQGVRRVPVANQGNQQNQGYRPHKPMEMIPLLPKAATRGPRRSQPPVAENTNQGESYELTPIHGVPERSDRNRR
ncbi:hypothetical protein AX14_011641 [Amanita brunnescens Koide BX004]|nr:hypothetical protein AX14_011641 [Amanita brunnescens Koide BX004]